MKKINKTNQWNPYNYNKHTAFVSQLALPVVDLLAPKKGEKILDVGCGEGDFGCRDRAKRCKSYWCRYEC